MHTSIIYLAAVFVSVLATPSPQASGTTGLPLGANCDPSIPNICANDVSCYATNSMLIPACGNFQASCTSDAQCAFNTCNNGFCSGLKPSVTTTPSPTPTPTPSNSLIFPVSSSSTISGYTNTSSTSTSKLTTTRPPPPTTPTVKPNTSVRYVNSTSTLDLTTGYVTSVVVVDGRTSSVLVNGAGATTPFGPSPTLQSSGGVQLVAGFTGFIAVAVGLAYLL